MHPNISKTSLNESLNYRKKNYSFSKSSKEKRNYLNNQNYSFSHQNNKSLTPPNELQNRNYRSKNDAPSNGQSENPIVFILFIYFFQFFMFFSFSFFVFLGQFFILFF